MPDVTLTLSAKLIAALGERFGTQDNAALKVAVKKFLAAEAKAFMLEKMADEHVAARVVASTVLDGDYE